jgi:aldose sugar dehydrogenase
MSFPLAGPLKGAQMRKITLAASIALILASPVFAAAPSSPQPQYEADPFKLTTIAKGLVNPWGLALLPDGRYLVTERPGRMRIVAKDGTLSEPLAGVPEVLARGQGGLLDITLSPKFSEDKLVYFSFAEPGEGGAGTAVARGKLTDKALENVQVIWRQTPKVNSPNHWGSRIVFRPDGSLFVTLGDRFNQRPLVQDVSTTIGKIVRINADGSVPKDNPFVGKADAKGEIWSVGHRSTQAAVLDPTTNQLWTVEHGARGGDELNNPQPGKNYGWPVITYGIDYNGSKIGEGTEKEGLEQPAYYWDPVIAPSGAVFYTGNAFPDWKGDLFVGSMQPGGLVRLKLENGKVTKETRYIGSPKQRVRDIAQGSDGLLYIITDSPNGELIRLDKK